ncbi:MAG: hypothetical protein HYZ40_10595 [Rhodospirillales bacterium]|nr:hypothetical protein [Rhodospirillales bacterium]
MTFKFLFDRGNNVLLVNYGRTLTRETVDGVFAAARSFVETHGACPAIADFSDVEQIDVDLAYWRSLGEVPRVMKGTKRVLVAPQDTVFGMIRMYGLHQAVQGDEPAVVRSLQAAYDLLGVRVPDFRPLA